jgi:hypothetical protein
MTVPVAEMSLPQLMKACDGYFLVPVPGSDGPPWKEWQPRQIPHDTYVEASNRLSEQLSPEIVPWARNLLRHADLDARERGAALLARAAEEGLLGDVRAEVTVELDELIRQPAPVGSQEALAKKTAIGALARLRSIRSLVALATVPSVKKEELAPTIKAALEKLAGRAFATSASALTWGRASVAAEDKSHKAWTIAVAAREKSGFKPYATTGRFGVGDLVNHPKFGNGIVTKVLESSKVEILFAEGSRVLLHTDG